MGHGFRFLLPFSLLPPPFFFQNFHINHSFFKIFIIIRFFLYLTISIDVIHHEQYVYYVYSVSTVFRLIQYKREGKQLHFHISRHIAHLGWETPVFFYTFYLVYIWHCRIKLFLRHLPNCPCSNFSRYVDLFLEISPRIAKQLRF